MADIVIKTIRLKRGTSSSWRRVNPVLLEGEPGFEKDTNKLKIGNGDAAWNDLPYLGGTFDLQNYQGKTIIIKDNKLQLSKFDEAEIGQVPSKSSQDDLEWIDIPTEISYNEAKELIQSWKEEE